MSMCNHVQVVNNINIRQVVVYYLSSNVISDTEAFQLKLSIFTERTEESSLKEISSPCLKLFQSTLEKKA